MGGGAEYHVSSGADESMVDVEWGDQVDWLASCTAPDGPRRRPAQFAELDAPPPPPPPPPAAVNAPRSAVLGTSADAMPSPLEKGRAACPTGDPPLACCLIEVVSDKQDLSFVDKVLLPETQIAALCNALLPGSAVIDKEGKLARLGFTSLDAVHLDGVVGLYGDKQLIAQILEDQGLLPRSILESMYTDALSPGLYAAYAPPKDKLYLFYWPGSKQMVGQEASRKDIACNFVRYLMELCSSVFVCVQGASISPSLTPRCSSSSFASRKQRTQRLQISLCKESEDDIKLLPGFNITLPLQDPLVLSQLSAGATTAGIDQAHELTSFLLSQGHHRTALLACVRMPAKVVTRNKAEALCPHSDAKSFLNSLFTSRYVDCTALPDDDFLILLHAMLKEDCLKLYKETEAAWKQKLASRTCNQDDLKNTTLKDAEQKIADAFERVLPHYLLERCPWEQTVLRNAWEQGVLRNTLKCPNSADDGNKREMKQNDDCSTVNEVDSKEDCANEQSAGHEQVLRENDTCITTESKVDSKDGSGLLSALTKLEEELCSIWSDDSAVEHGRLLFSGAELQIFNSDKSRSYGMFLIEWPASAGLITPKPICFMQQVTLKPVLRDDETEQRKRVTYTVRLNPNGTSMQASENVAGPIIFAGAKNELMVTIQCPLQRIRCPFAGSVCMTQAATDQGLGMKTWIDGLSQRRLPPSLEKRVKVASYLMQKLGTKLAFSEKLLKSLLTSDVQIWTKLNFEKGIKDDVAGLIIEHYENSDSSAASIQSEVVSAGWSLYSTACDGLRDGIRAMVKQDICPLIASKLERGLKLKATAAKDEMEKELSNLLQATKQQVSIDTQSQQDMLRVKLKGFSTHSAGKSWYNPFSSATTKVTLTYDIEEIQKETVTWTASELIASKRDLDQLINGQTSSHTVVPSCSKPMEVAVLDPSQEILSKVVILKGGQVLHFVVAKNKSYMHIYLCPRLGVSLTGRNPLRQYKRGFDLVAYDEVSRLMAMYDQSLSSIKAFRLDESFQHMEWTGMEIQLSQFAGSTELVWMEFNPGKREIILADGTNRVRVVELAPVMMKPRHILLPAPLRHACITPDGSCFLVFTSNCSSDDGMCSNEEEPSSQFEINATESSDEEEQSSQFGANATESSSLALLLYVYLLDDTLTLLKKLDLDPFAAVNADLVGLQVDCKYFGPQMHLTIHSAREKGKLASWLLDVSCAAQAYQLRKVGNSKLPLESADAQHTVRSSCPHLDYVFHVLDKFATSPPLRSSGIISDFCVLLNPPPNDRWDRMGSEEKCLKHVLSSIQQLKEKGKDFSKLDLRVSVESCPFADARRLKQQRSSKVTMGSWVQRLVCLVPLQIARAENNTLKPLINGLQIPAHAVYADAVSLASLLRFGLYDLVLADWKGHVKVISSMGKQSSGKSYLLNHLAGSLLDVAGGRCTDGVWITVIREPDCMYVLLDFEGLGSFERSEQEDMLLSILNAAISNVTIFNKKDFHLDKETEAIFQRFQDGVSLVKADAKLFKGLFYMAIKDVDASDVEDLKVEFFEKIHQICNKSKENFLTTMYGGEVEIAAMPPFQRPEFHDSISDIGETIKDLFPTHTTGHSIMLDLKLVVAQISARDWAPVDSKRLAMRLNLIRMHLENALRLGNCLDGMPLVNFDTQEELKDELVHVAGQTLAIRDAGLELAADSNETMGVVLSPLKEAFSKVVQRKGTDEDWFSLYESFLAAVVERRKSRVLAWLQSNTRDFPEDSDLQKLQLETQAVLSEMKHKLVLCSCKCKSCFLKCILEKGHTCDHSCLGDHTCTEECTFCAEECKELENRWMALSCNDPAGHDGAHDCKRRKHTCGKPCVLFEKASNCNETCSLRAHHEGDHRCNSRQHVCGKKCALPSCNNDCVFPLELGDHERHACHEKFCPRQCCMDGCLRTCVEQDHFHQLVDGAEHLCADEHPCRMKCEAEGVCHVQTEIVKQTRSFHGRRGDFDYDYVSEQSEQRKTCCIMIPPLERCHGGPHTHTSNKNAVHFCDVRCPACDYYCQLPFGHAGLHKTVHGNMTKMKFVSEEEDIDIQDRKYARGESGEAEMCMMHCKARGRGHTHLVPCPGEAEGGCCTEKLFDGARHIASKCAGLGRDVPLDEMTHEAYWHFIRFMDPCEEAERASFALCDHFCRSDEHLAQGSLAAAGRSYCTENLWHAPVPARKGGVQVGGSSGGYVTEDGHHFACDHSKHAPHNVIFVIDKSGSMDCRDIRPSLSKFHSGHANRLGCVYEAMVRFIKIRLQATSLQPVKDTVSVVLFDDSGFVATKLEPMTEAAVDALLKYGAGGGTTYSEGLQRAEEVLREAMRDAETAKKSPVVVFLSDGGNYGGMDPVYVVGRMKVEDARLVVHTIMFGNDPYAHILQAMAQAGDGSFQTSLDEVQLAKSFEDLAKSLKPKLAALCSSSASW